MKQQFYEGIIEQTNVPVASGNTSIVALVQYYNTIVQIDKNNTWVDSDCAEIAFLNIGDGNFPTPAGATVMILGFPVKPGFGISFDGENQEIDKTKYLLTFVGAGVKNCAVFRKMYR
jgi:hypothetical protein